MCTRVSMSVCNYLCVSVCLCACMHVQAFSNLLEYMCAYRYEWRRAMHVHTNIHMHMRAHKLHTSHTNRGNGGRNAREQA